MTARRRRFGKKKGRAGARFALVLVLLLAAALVVGGRVFVVRRIAVRGNQTIADQDIVARSGLEMGKSIFSVNVERIGEAFARDGLVALESVNVTWPDLVQLSVRERVPHAIVEYLGTAIVVDEKLTVMQRLGDLPAMNLPVVTGVSVIAAIAGQELQVGVEGQVGAIVDVIFALKQENSLEAVSELNASDLDNLYLITRGGMMVEVGDEQNMPAKIVWMNSVLEKLAQEGLSGGTLDVSSGKSGIYSP